MSKSGIYVITNSINGKIYIGSSVNITERWYRHKRLLRRGIHHNKHLQSSWNKYGESEFVFKIIEECEIDNLTLREQHFLDILKPQYNICPTAGSSLGWKHSEETKKHLSKIGMGNRNRCGKNPGVHLKKAIIGGHIEYSSLTEACKQLGLKGISSRLIFALKNGTTYRDCTWRYK